MNALRRLFVLVVGPVLVACSASSDDTGPGPSTGLPPGGETCTEGFTPLDGGAGCTPVLPPDRCPPGTRAAIGQTACVPVGVTACAPGFERDASGWGCAAVIAPVTCAVGSGTRERLGTTSCVPVSDCNAAFPPPSATLTVDAAFADAQLDATHFRVIADAVTAAPAGATIAVEAGTYTEHIVLKRRAVNIVGRCAEKVLVKQADGVLGSAVEINGGDDALVKNLSFHGYNAAISALGGKARLDSLIIEDGLLAGVVGGNAGTDVHLVNVVIRGMQVRSGGDQAFGVFASFGANVVVEDSVLSGNEYVNAGATKSDTTLSIKRSILRDGKPWGTKRALGMGVYAAEGAAVTIEESAVIDNSAAGVEIVGPTPSAGTVGTIRRSVIRGTKLDDANKFGRGADVNGAKLVVEQSTIAESTEHEVLATAGGTAQISDTALVGRAQVGDGDCGALGIVASSATLNARSVAIVASRAGVETIGTAKVMMESALVSGTRVAPTVYENGHWIGVGIFVGSESSLTLTGSTVEDAHVTGTAILGTVDLTQTLIRGTRPSLARLGGRGMAIQSGATVTMTSSAVMDSTEAGILVQLDGTTLALSSSTIQRTELDGNARYGLGLLFGGGATGSVEGCTITGSKGIGVAVAGGGAFVHGSVISRNTVGVHAQEGTTLREGDTAGDLLSFVVSPDTRFVENTTRVGNGIVPLPQVLDSVRAVTLDASARLQYGRVP